MFFFYLYLGHKNFTVLVQLVFIFRTNRYITENQTELEAGTLSYSDYGTYEKIPILRQF